MLFAIFSSVLLIHSVCNFYFIPLSRHMIKIANNVNNEVEDSNMGIGVVFVFLPTILHSMSSQLLYAPTFCES